MARYCYFFIFYFFEELIRNPDFATCKLHNVISSKKERPLKPKVGVVPEHRWVWLKKETKNRNESILDIFLSSQVFCLNKFLFKKTLYLMYALYIYMFRQHEQIISQDLNFCLFVLGPYLEVLTA